MFESLKMIISASKIHLNGLKQGMQDAESRYLNNQYTLRAFVEILEYRVRVGSAPMINQRKLANKYIKDFCRRNSINSVDMIIQIQDIVDPEKPNFNGEVYYSK